MIEPPLHIVLVRPLIPPNAGNVARLCAATGCALHLVEPLGFSLDDRQLKRAGLDYWEHVRVSVWPDFQHLQQAMDPRPFHLFSSRVKRPYTQAPYGPGDVLVFGNEENGLPDDLLLAHADNTYTIPMWGAVRSLNLSTSVGIVTYEALRAIFGF
ncbi:MAG TPA: tRNA (cytidine(34)-2'-O)-methyltransferase [Acidobacteriota bacterium]|nr:tRNA (cytidine(34)-2'-O)-methyltransferase [Acidobacteriota bacterium]